MAQRHSSFKLVAIQNDAHKRLRENIQVKPPAQPIFRYVNCLQGVWQPLEREGAFQAVFIRPVDVPNISAVVKGDDCPLL